MKKIEKAVKNLSKYTLIYTLLIIIVGIFVSHIFSLKFLYNYVPIIIFLMIYPMMVNISFKNLKNIKKSRGAVAIGLAFNFFMF